MKRGDLVLVIHNMTPLFPEGSLPGTYAVGMANSDEVGVFLGRDETMAIVLIRGAKHTMYERSIWAPSGQCFNPAQRG